VRGDRTRIIGRPPDVLSPEFQPMEENQWKRRGEVKDALRTGNTTLSGYIVRWMGRISLSSIHRVDDVGGKPALFAIWRDITERKRAEERWPQASAVSSSSGFSDDITITDMDGCIRMVSPVAIQMFGYEREEEILGARSSISWRARILIAHCPILPSCSKAS